MNEDLLHILMTDIDPARDLNDETLDELVPHNRLMAQVLAHFDPSTRSHANQQAPIWRRVTFRVSAAAAAVLVVASGAVAILNSSTSLELRGLALGKVHPSWVHSSMSSGIALLPARYTTSTGTYSELGLVRRGRIDTTLKLDGLTIAPPSFSVHPKVSESVMSKELWATTALVGTSQVALAYGDITLNLAGAPKLRNVPVWVAIATTKPCGATTCDVSKVASLPLTIVVSGYGLSSAQTETGTPIAFVYQSPGEKSTANPRLLAAIEQVSSPWVQDGPMKNRRLLITAGPFPCGALHGYSLVNGANGTTLTVESRSAESSMGDYCALSLTVRKAIPLTTTDDGITKWLINPSAPLVHATTGPMVASK
jgi:hypothetical protein